MQHHKLLNGHFSMNQNKALPPQAFKQSAFRPPFPDSSGHFPLSPFPMMNSLYTETEVDLSPSCLFPVLSDVEHTCVVKGNRFPW